MLVHQRASERRAGSREEFGSGLSPVSVFSVRSQADSRLWVIWLSSRFIQLQGISRGALASPCVPWCPGLCYDDPRRIAGLLVGEWSCSDELIVGPLAMGPDPGEVNGNFPVSFITARISSPREDFSLALPNASANWHNSLITSLFSCFHRHD